MSPNHQFSFTFSTFLARRCWASLGVRGHPLGPLGAISGLVGLFLGPSRGHLLPLLGFLGRPWAPFGSSWGHLRACWALPGAISWPSFAAIGLPWASMGILWILLGPSQGLLGSSWVHLVDIFSHVGPSWEALWSYLGPAWIHLGPGMGQIGRPWGPPWQMAMCRDLSTLTLTLALVVHGWLAGELSVVWLFPGALAAPRL